VRKLLITLSILLIATATYAQSYTVERVIDGDTIRLTNGEKETQMDVYSSPNEIFNAWVEAGEQQDWKRTFSLFIPESQKQLFIRTIVGAGMHLALNENNPEYKDQITELDAIWKKYKIIELGNAAEDDSYLWNIENKENLYVEIMTVLAKTQKEDTWDEKKLKDVVIDGDTAQGIFEYKEEDELKHKKMDFKKIDHHWFIVWQEDQ